MIRRVLVVLPLAVLAACSGTDSTAPSVTPRPPDLAISDGAHAGGNVDFFFLPPIVLPTGPLTNWTPNGFNGLLSPSVEICRLVATTAAAVETPAGSQCRTSNPTPVVLSGTDVKKHFPPVSDPGDVIGGLPGDWAHYHAKFPLPHNCNTTFFYRVRVKVGTTELGFADVQCVTRIFDLFRVDFKKFGAGFRGLPLQIPFRIEKYALCEVPGVGPCASAEVNLTTATAPVTISLPPDADDPPGSGPSGVTLSPQALPPTVFTVQNCPDLNNRATDLPTFGGCIRITANPALPPAGLAVAASVFVCNLGTALPPGMSHAQSELITLHRLDETPTQTLTALPHAPGCPQFDAPVTGSVGGLLRDLVGGRVTSAGNQLLAMLGPKPLYARRLNQGGGGLTSFFSDFEFALPSYLEIQSGDGQVAPPGSTLPNDPTVMVKDLGGEPVAGARVTFAPTDGSANPLVVVTGGSGLASTQWTLGASPGSNSLVAGGRGLAGTDNNGPRSDVVDPFQPIQTPFDVGGPPVPSEVTVVTGSVTFSATGVAPGSPLPVNYGSGGWSYQIDGTVPPDWFSSALTPFSSTGTAGFGEDHNSCPLILSGTNTNWPAGSTTLYARKTISLPSATTVQISVAIDNDVQIYVDGVDIGPGLLTHGGCPTEGSFVRTLSLSAGSHVIAFRAVDTGGSSYFDAEIIVSPTF